MAAVPIWRDHYVGLSGEYRIIIDETGDIVYSGNAVAKPGELNAQVRINDICADYLENVLPNIDPEEFVRTTDLTFVTQIKSGQSWIDRDSVNFYNDWSYDYRFNPATMGLSFPVNGRVDYRMPIIWTGYEVSEVVATIYLNDGTSYQVIIPVEITADFNNDFNDDFAISARAAGSGTAVFYPWSYGINVSKIVIGHSTFNIVHTCSKYALYYVNAHGGWDALLIEGKTIESDSLKRYTREVVYDNRSYRSRGIKNYVNEITKEFTFHTGWLTGNQGELMHNLINSTDVYMYDMDNDHMIPVTIPSTTCEYKTFKNQNHQLVNYAILVQVAQNRIRR